MQTSQLIHLLKWQFTSHKVVALLPGKRADDLTLQDAITTLNMALVSHVVEKHGICAISDYRYHLHTAMDAGDDAAKCVDFMLQNEAQLHDCAWYPPLVKWKKGHLKMFHVLWKHHKNNYFSRERLTTDLLQHVQSTRDVAHARTLLVTSPRHIHFVHRLCDSYEFACEIVAAFRTCRYERSQLPAIKTALYWNAVQRNDLQSMQMIIAELNGFYLFDMEANYDTQFARALLTQPLTQERKQVLGQVMTDFGLRERPSYNYLLYMISEEDLVVQPAFDVIDMLRRIRAATRLDESDGTGQVVKPSGLAQLIIQYGGQNIPKHRRHELFHEHISSFMRGYIRKLGHEHKFVDA